MNYLDIVKFLSLFIKHTDLTGETVAPLAPVELRSEAPLQVSVFTSAGAFPHPDPFSYRGRPFSCFAKDFVV